MKQNYVNEQLLLQDLIKAKTNQNQASRQNYEHKIKKPIKNFYELAKTNNTYPDRLGGKETIPQKNRN